MLTADEIETEAMILGRKITNLLLEVGVQLSAETILKIDSF